MSWLADAWKDGLSPMVLQKISAIEKQNELLKKDKEQKQIQLENLDQVRLYTFS